MTRVESVVCLTKRFIGYQGTAEYLRGLGFPLPTDQLVALMKRYAQDEYEDEMRAISNRYIKDFAEARRLTISESEAFMLYGKIYLDKDENERDMLVFVSLAGDDIDESRASMVDYIAISPEAKAVFSARLERGNPMLKLGRYFGDFALIGDDGWEHGSFHFEADQEKNGQKHRTLREGDMLSLSVEHGCRRDVLNYMIPCGNDYLKVLDLMASVDENTLWERHFAAMRSRGEEIGCDAEDIRKTPPAFMTDAQKATVRQAYRAECDRYNAQEWHDHGDYLEDRIVRELMLRFLKNGPVIEELCNPH